MSYEFLEHESDIGIRGIGKDEIEAFQETAKALFDVMVDIKKIKPKESIAIEVKAPDLESLLVEWLNELIFQKDFTNLYFSEFKIKELKKNKNEYHLWAIVSGEKLDPKKHQTKTDAKAATYSGLKCKKENKNFYCQCVVDV